jgi:hypothetical protein
LYLPKDEEELFRHLYPHFVTDNEDKDTAYNTDNTDNTNISEINDDEELVRKLFPWLLEN